ncbi:MAG: tight adherence protein [Solirubrobacteraceae bacterium]|nr:tight adherence protein [Solirubrobacteraceae bacterium]
MSARVRTRRTRWAIPASVVAVLAGCLLMAPISSADENIRISQGGGASFPARSLVLSVPSRSSLRTSNVHITENGRPVAGTVVTPITKAGARDFGVVLAIDVSPSMKGAPLAEAMVAARALAAQRSGKQELAVVTFDQHARVTLPLTDDPRAIARTLAHPPAVGHGAYIYNAMSVAVQQLARARIAAGAVILLSDGASQGARPRSGHNLTATSVGAAAAAAHAQIYTVGLRDRSYTPQRMDLLARVGGGAFIESTSSELSGVFTRIEASLTHAYVVHYRSLAPLGERVKVDASIDGIPQVASLEYDSPPGPRAPSPSAVRSRSFWASTLALVLASFGAALLIVLGLFAVVAPRLRRGGVLGRVREFTARATSEAPETIAGASSPPLPSSLERLLERTRWWPGFKMNAEIARMTRPPVELVALTASGTIVAAVLLGVVIGVPVSIVVLLLGPFALRSLVMLRLHRQRDLFAEQLPTLLQELASAMRTGHSLVAGVTSIAQGAPEPSRSEWAQVVADEQLGRPLEEAMQPMAVRMDCADIGQVAIVASLQRRTGGNMAEVLERVADSARERADLRHELHSLTAQARLSRYIVTALPPAITGLIAIINPSYIRPLFDTTVGVALLFVAGGLLFAASLVMRAITDVKV